MGSNLKPCPFCGSGMKHNALLVLDRDGDEVKITAIRCVACGAEGPCYKHKGREALAAWNTRAGEGK